MLRKLSSKEAEPVHYLRAEPLENPGSACVASTRFCGHRSRYNVLSVAVWPRGLRLAVAQSA